MFHDNNTDTYTDVVIGYISKCTDDVVPRITVWTLLNQKPWFNICEGYFPSASKKTSHEIAIATTVSMRLSITS